MIYWRYAELESCLKHQADNINKFKYEDDLVQI